MIKAWLIIGLAAGMVAGCTPGKIQEDVELDKFPDIKPNYSGTVIPPNIAPLNFLIQETGEKYHVEVKGGNSSIRIEGDEVVRFPEKDWKQLLQENKGDSVTVTVFAHRNGQWERYRSMVHYVAEEPIDPFLAYRLIEPLYETWSEMGIYQRNLESFEEKAIFSNRLTENQCINCHAFQNGDPNKMMFHQRGAGGGTLIMEDNSLQKVDTDTDQTISAGVYPSWHPNLPLVAFSVNDIGQMFHSRKPGKVEVVDVLSDLVLYNIEDKEIREIMNTKDTLETFPHWSPDGRKLYYCSASIEIPDSLSSDRERSYFVSDNYDRIKYSVLRRSFDPDEQTFGETDTIVSAEETGKSASFPRISPDGRYLLVTLSDYGNFSIWHKSSDLYLVDIRTGELVKPGNLNSPDVESYHSWSSNGRWMIYSSRRDDGSYTRPYIAYFKRNGVFSDPFVLPQKNPRFYDRFYKSYNIPELIKRPVNMSIRKIEKIAEEDPSEVSFSSQ